MVEEECDVNEVNLNAKQIDFLNIRSIPILDQLDGEKYIWSMKHFFSHSKLRKDEERKRKYGGGVRVIQ